MDQSAILTLLLPIYGITTMAGLLNINRSNFKKENVLKLVIFLTIAIIVNVFVLINFDTDVYRKCYIFLIQIPLFFGFRIISEFRGIKLLFTLLTTITLASLPVNFVVICRILANNNAQFMMVGFILSFIIMIFLVFKLLRTSYIYMLKWGETKMFWKFSIIPILYYIYGYLGSGYNFVQYNSFDNYFVQMIPNLVVFVSYILIIDIFKNVQEKQLLKNQQDLMLTQLDGTTKQLEQIRMLEKQSAIYRHDLRHHMNYLNACISENKLKEATDYISQTFDAMDNIKLEQYSTNEPMNLILSSYVSKAREQGIAIEISVTTMDFERYHITDLCSLLANALENAIKSCAEVERDDERHIYLRMYNKNHKLCIHIANCYAIEPTLEQGIPISHKDGHGIGVKSMIHVIEKYEGIYGFSAKDGLFTFQVSM